MTENEGQETPAETGEAQPVSSDPPLYVDPGRLREIRQKLDAAEAAQSRAEQVEFFGSMRELAERMMARFSELPCRGLLASIASCSDEFAAACHERASPSCPRQIASFDSQQRAREFEQQLEGRGIPQGARKIIAHGLEPTPAKQAVDEFLSGQRRILVLAGSAGTGKSTAAAYALSRVPGRFLHCAEFGRLGGFDAVSKAEHERLISVPLLVFDDLGSEYSDAKGWFNSAFESLVVRRYDDELKTLVTTNLSPKSFRDRYGERVVDRVRAGSFEVVGTKSMRTK